MSTVVMINGRDEAKLIDLNTVTEIKTVEYSYLKICTSNGSYSIRFNSDRERDEVKESLLREWAKLLKNVKIIPSLKESIRGDAIELNGGKMSKN